MQRIYKPAMLLASVLLVFTVCFGFNAASAMAVEQSDVALRVAEVDPAYAPTLSTEEMSVAAGDTVTLNVQITGNPGIIGATLEVNYDSRLALVGITNGEAFRELEMTKPGEMKSGCRIHWDAPDLIESDVKDGTVVTLTFNVSKEASAGDSYFVNVVAATANGQPDVYDRDLEPVNLQPATCNVTVKSNPSEHSTHAYGSWTTLAEATCTQSGLREKSCSECGDKVTEVVPALGHVWGEGVVTKAATYDDEGMVAYTCARCGITREETVPVLQPSSPMLRSDDVIVKAGDAFDMPVRLYGNPGIIGATLVVDYDSRLMLTNVTNGEAFGALELTKPGELKSGCKIHWDTTDIADDDVKSGVVATLSFVATKDVYKSNAVCAVNIYGSTTDGRIDVYDVNLDAVNLLPTECSVTIEPSGAAHAPHIYSSWEMVTEATCTIAGSRERVCSVCGEKETESIAALGHSWNAGKVTKAATYDATGVRTYTCVRCGKTRTETISKLPRTSLKNATVTVAKSMAYTGKALTPTPTVKVSGKTLKKGTDYTVAYKNNKNAGTATVTVTGKGAYEGSKSVTFKVAVAANTAIAKSTSVKKTLAVQTLKSKAQTVALPKVTTKFGTAKWTVSAKDVKKVLSLSSSKVKVKKGAKKGVYTMKLKASVAKTKNYAAATTKVVTVKVTVK